MKKFSLQWQEHRLLWMAPPTTPEAAPAQPEAEKPKETTDPKKKEANEKVETDPTAGNSETAKDLIEKGANIAASALRTAADKLDQVAGKMGVKDATQEKAAAKIKPKTQETAAGDATGSKANAPIEGVKENAGSAQTPNGKEKQDGKQTEKPGNKNESQEEKTDSKKETKEKELDPAVEKIKKHFLERYSGDEKQPGLDEKRQETVMKEIEGLPPEKAQALVDSYKTLTSTERDIYNKAGPKIVERLNRMSPEDIKLYVQDFTETDPKKLKEIRGKMSAEGNKAIEETRPNFTSKERAVWDKLDAKYAQLMAKNGGANNKVTEETAADSQMEDAERKAAQAAGVEYKKEGEKGSPESQEGEPQTKGELLKQKMEAAKLQLLNAETDEDKMIATIAFLMSMFDYIRATVKGELDDPINGEEEEEDGKNEENDRKSGRDSNDGREDSDRSSGRRAAEGSDRKGERKERSRDDNEEKEKKGELPVEDVRTPKTEAEEERKGLETIKEDEAKLEKERNELGDQLKDVITKNNEDKDTTKEERDEEDKLKDKIMDIDEKLDEIEAKKEKGEDRAEALGKEQQDREELIAQEWNAAKSPDGEGWAQSVELGGDKGNDLLVVVEGGISTEKLAQVTGGRAVKVEGNKIIFEDMDPEFFGNKQAGSRQELMKVLGQIKKEKGEKEEPKPGEEPKEDVEEFDSSTLEADLKNTLETWVEAAEARSSVERGSARNAISIEKQGEGYIVVIDQAQLDQAGLNGAVRNTVVNMIDPDTTGERAGDLVTPVMDEEQLTTFCRNFVTQVNDVGQV